jgi:hypothetical protein
VANLLPLLLIAGSVAYVMTAKKKKRKKIIGAEIEAEVEAGDTVAGGEEDRTPINPPNVSHDPAGYNTTAFGAPPSPASMRLGLRTVGYQISVWPGDLPKPLNPPAGGGAVLPNPYVIAFQAEWNLVIRKIGAGTLAPKTETAEPLYPFRGIVATDGIIGKHTLNALEIAIHNQQKSGVHWKTLVSQA